MAHSIGYSAVYAVSTLIAKNMKSSANYDCWEMTAVLYQL